MKTLVVVLGPTGVGKTELCLTLAEHLGTPIVNADSRQIFQELPIGTAAPTLEQQRRVPHYFVGNHHIEDYYSAAMYEADVMSLLQNDIFTQHDTALLTGGSMMYIDAVCKGIDDIPTVRDDIRTWMKEDSKRKDSKHSLKSCTNSTLSTGLSSIRRIHEEWYTPWRFAIRQARPTRLSAPPKRNSVLSASSKSDSTETEPNSMTASTSEYS